LAGFDWRWSTRLFRTPTVFYGQMIGEDEAGGFPSRYLGQLGVSVTTPINATGGTLRTSLEFSDTTCQFYESSKLFDCAYNSSIYTSGYRYRGRSIGHSTDGDSRQVALLAQYTGPSGHTFSATVRQTDLNRAGALESPHSLTRRPRETSNVELLYQRPLAGGRLMTGIGFDRTNTQEEESISDARVFVGWQMGM
ncbi:MAG: capsule assembly Wzi family protein, partial [Pseudomonadota bacterium]